MAVGIVHSRASQTTATFPGGTRSFRTLAIAVILAAAFLSNTATAADAPAAANKWHVDFNGRAASDGEMQFRLTPHEGDPILITAAIHKGRAQMFIAQDVRDTFKSQLPKGRFRAEVVEGERLVLKAASGEQDFLLELVQSSVDGSRIHISPG